MRASAILSNHNFFHVSDIGLKKGDKWKGTAYLIYLRYLSDNYNSHTNNSNINLTFGADRNSLK